MASNLDNELKQTGITDSFQKELLAAGRADGLSSDRRQRLVANIGFAIGAPPALLPDDIWGNTSSLSDAPGLGDMPGLNNTAGLSDVVASKALQVGGFQSLAAKVVGTAVLGGLSIWGGYSWLAPSPKQELLAAPQQQVFAPPEQQPQLGVRAERSKADNAAVSNAAVLNAMPNDGEATTLAEEPPEFESAESSTKGRKHAASDSLARELALIEMGRAELLRSNPAGTLNTLSKYRKEFPKGTLLAEATVLRVEALIANGNRSAASDIGEAFLRRSPNSPYSRRISSLLGSSYDVGAKAADTKR